jgi:hypothetical protein
MSDSNKFDFMAASSAGMDIAGMYATALKKPEDIDMPEYNGFSQRRDINSIRDMEFEKNPFNFGNVLKGASSGIGAGGSLGPVGAVAGGAIGGVLGLGASIIEAAKQKKQQQEFEQKKREAMRDAMFANASIDMKDRMFRNLGTSSRNQLDRLVSGLSRIS